MVAPFPFKPDTSKQLDRMQRILGRVGGLFQREEGEPRARTQVRSVLWHVASHDRVSNHCLCLRSLWSCVILFCCPQVAPASVKCRFPVTFHSWERLIYNYQIRGSFKHIFSGKTPNFEPKRLGPITMRAGASTTLHTQPILIGMISTVIASPLEHRATHHQPASFTTQSGW